MLSLQYQKVRILLTYLHNIDIDIATFCKYRIDIASRLKKWYRSRTTQSSSWLRRLCQQSFLSTAIPQYMVVLYCRSKTGFQAAIPQQLVDLDEI